VTKNTLRRKVVLIECQGINVPAESLSPDRIIVKEAAAVESDGRSQTHADKN
jgi:hypothetical protein